MVDVLEKHMLTVAYTACPWPGHLLCFMSQMLSTIQNVFPPPKVRKCNLLLDFFIFPNTPFLFLKYMPAFRNCGADCRGKETFQRGNHCDTVNSSRLKLELSSLVTAIWLGQRAPLTENTQQTSQSHHQLYPPFSTYEHVTGILVFPYYK